MAGLTATGFEPKRLAEIRAELEALAQSPEFFGESADVGPDGPLGHLIGIFAEREADIWELMQALYDSFVLENAIGVQLDNLGQNVGVPREGATFGSGIITALGDAATALLAGRRSKKTSTGETVDTLADATLLAVGAWAPSTAYTVGARRENGGNVYQVTTAGTSDSSGGPTGTGTAIADNDVFWRYLGSGDAAADINARATVAGSFDAQISAIDEIVTPVTGWNTVLNLAAFVQGVDQESDADYRARIRLSLQIVGAGTDGSIRAALLAREDVILCVVKSNRSELALVFTPTAPPLPAIPAALASMNPRSFMAVIWPPTGLDEDAIAEVIFDKQPAGVESQGDITKITADDQGFSQTVKFAKAVEVLLWVTVDLLEVGPDYEGDDAVEAAIVTEGNELGLGQTVIYNRLICAVQDIAGVIDFALKVDAQAAPTATSNIVLPPFFISRFDSSRVVVNPVP